LATMKQSPEEVVLALTGKAHLEFIRI